MINKKEKGQVVLIVLLVSALVLTMGLSISKNTVTETKIDTDEDLLKQAFNTAESGVEYYLATKETTYDAGNGSASVVATPIGSNNNLDSGGVVLTGKPFLFWLVDHNSNGSIGNNTFTGTIDKICLDNNFGGALKIDLFSLNGTNYSVTRYGYNIKTDIVNGFSRINTNCTGSITATGGMLLVVTPIGGSTNISVTGSGDEFPSQGEKIVSVGQMASGVNTKVTVLNRFDEVPPFMLETITSGNSVLSQ
ncbi:MAG: hypothetical protein PHX34_01605 [Candidatus Shapirobacteria bacterium]|nr:hypothetical protein [Candidatus Shapirobacteria bacterium]